MKEKLRQILKEKRGKLSDAEVAQLSLDIFGRVSRSKEFESAKNILLYFSKEKEVQTRALFELCLDLGKKVYAPKVSGKEMEIFRVKTWEDLEMGSFGVLEPKDECEAGNVRQLDLIFVPGLGFDLAGNRLGYGKAYYDRFLKDSSAFKVGLCYELQILDEIPTEKHDVSMDGIATEKQIYYT